MAPTKDALVVRSKSVSDIQCNYCNKTVVNTVKCSKCLEAFHPACLIQAASLKKAICKHTAVESDEVKNVIGNETFYLLKIIKELEQKYSLLEENCNLWKEKANYLEGKLKKSDPITMVSNQTQQSQKTVRLRPDDKNGRTNADKSERLPSLSVNTENKHKHNAAKESRTCENNWNDQNTGKTSKTPEIDVFNADQETGDSEFEFPRYRGRKTNQKRKRNPFVGSNTDASDCETFNTSPSINNKKIWLFVHKINEHVGDTTIKEYIVKRTNSIPENVVVKKCIPKESKSRKQWGFMVGVPPEFKEAIYAEQFWPAGVAYERFNFGRGKNFLDQQHNPTTQIGQVI